MDAGRDGDTSELFNPSLSASIAVSLPGGPLAPGRDSNTSALFILSFSGPRPALDGLGLATGSDALIGTDCDCDAGHVLVADGGGVAVGGAAAAATCPVLVHCAMISVAPAATSVMSWRR